MQNTYFGAIQFGTFKTINTMHYSLHSMFHKRDVKHPSENVWCIIYFYENTTKHHPRHEQKAC